MAATTEPIRFHSFRADSPDGDVLSAVRADSTLADLLRVDPATGDTIVRAVGPGGVVLLQDAAGAPLATSPHQHAAGDVTSGVLDPARIPADLTTKAVLGRGTLPEAATEGRLWWDAAAGFLKRDSGGAWEPVPVAWSAVADKPATFAPAPHGHAWAEITSAPTTLAGFGVTDAYTQAESDARYAPLAHVHDAFGTVANAAGQAQFTASGLDALQLAAGNDLAVSFDAANRRVTFSYTGGTNGAITAAFASVSAGGSSATATGADTLGFAAGAGLSASLETTSKTVTYSLGDHSADLLTTGTVAVDLLAGAYTGITGVGALTAGAWNASIIAPAYGGTGVDASAAANGALLVGNGTGFSLATLTAGSGLSVTNAAGSITLAATGAAYAGCRLHRSSTFNVQSGTWTAVTWDAESWDADGWHSTATNPSRITPTRAGKVRVHAQYYMSTSSLGYARGIAVYKNGVVHAEWAIQQHNGGSGTYSQVSDEVEVNGTTDYIEIFALQDSGSPLGLLSGSKYTFVTVAFLGA